MGIDTQQACWNIQNKQEGLVNDANPSHAVELFVDFEPMQHKTSEVYC